MFEISRSVSALGSKDSLDMSFSEALQSIYGFGDRLILYWNNTVLEVYIKYDLSVSWRDIQKMMLDLKSKKEAFSLIWPSQSFWGAWNFSLGPDDILSVVPNWSQPIQDTLIVPRKSFLVEWEKAVSDIRQDLISQGYVLNELENY